MKETIQSVFCNSVSWRLLSSKQERSGRAVSGRVTQIAEAKHKRSRSMVSSSSFEDQILHFGFRTSQSSRIWPTLRINSALSSTLLLSEACWYVSRCQSRKFGPGRFTIPVVIRLSKSTSPLRREFSGLLFPAEHPPVFDNFIHSNFFQYYEVGKSNGCNFCHSC